MEQFDQKPAGRISQVGRTQASIHSRPISADDIQKAKMRAMFMQHKYGKADGSSSENMKVEDCKELPTPQSKRILPSTIIMEPAQVNGDEEKLAEVLLGCSETPMETLSSGVLHEELLEGLKRSQLQWQAPPGISLFINFCLFIYSALFSGFSVGANLVLVSFSHWKWHFG